MTFKPSRNKAFIEDNIESIIDFNMDPKFNRLTCEINDSKNFDSIRQIDGDNTAITTAVNKAIMLTL